MSRWFFVFKKKKIFDLFLELQPLFKSLRIDDDEGLWHQYSAQKKPCKIKLRPLSADERKVLERIQANNLNPPTEVERFVMAKTTLQPYYKALLRLIVQDFIRIMDIKSIDDFDPEAIVDTAKGFVVDSVKKVDFMGEAGNCFSVKSFSFDFPYILLKIWIGYTFEYKKMGLVKGLTGNIRGLTTSAIAALYGIRSIFLNRHCGINNAKEAEMNKFAKQYYKTHAMGEVMVIDEPERELEMLFSMLDYLGFKYVGVNEIKEN